eukprot:1138957-Pelagomonas_calceolata.AAC.9
MTWPRWPWGQQGGTANGVQADALGREHNQDLQLMREIMYPAQTKGVHPAAGSQAAGLQGQPPHRPTPGPPSTNSRGEQARMGLAYGSSSSGSTSSIWSSYGDKGRSCRMSRCYRPSGTKRKKCPTLTVRTEGKSNAGRHSKVGMQSRRYHSPHEGDGDTKCMPKQSELAKK